MFLKLTVARFILALSVLFILIPVAVSAQLNYSSEGDRVRAAGESVSITIDKRAEHGSKALTGPVSFSGVIGSVIGLGIDVTKGILSSAEQKYAATYTGTKSENQLIYFHKDGDLKTADLNIGRISLTRSFLNQKGDWVVGCHFSLAPDMPDNNGLFRFKLDSLYLPFAKAKIKKVGSRGKRIDLLITIKLDALWQEAIPKEAVPKEGDTSKPPTFVDNGSFQIKSATLGETNILVSSITPEGQVKLNNDNYSGWYQLPPAPSLKFANAENKWKIGNYVVTITVKEANPYGLNAKDRADFFNSTATDLGSLLKQFFSDPSKKN